MKIKLCHAASGTSFLLGLVVLTLPLRSGAAQRQSSDLSGFKGTHAQVPLTFERNAGQTDPAGANKVPQLI